MSRQKATVLAVVWAALTGESLGFTAIHILSSLFLFVFVQRLVSQDQLSHSDQLTADLLINNGLPLTFQDTMARHHEASRDGLGQLLPETPNLDLLHGNTLYQVEPRTTGMQTHPV